MVHEKVKDPCLQAVQMQPPPPTPQLYPLASFLATPTPAPVTLCFTHTEPQTLAPNVVLALACQPLQVLLLPGTPLAAAAGPLSRSFLGFFCRTPSLTPPPLGQCRRAWVGCVPCYPLDRLIPEGEGSGQPPAGSPALGPLPGTQQGSMHTVSTGSEDESSHGL